jgi:hypothetical protein
MHPLSRIILSRNKTAMLKLSQVSTRSVSFFVPATRVSEFNRRTLQSNPTVELLEENYNDLDHYYIKVFPSVQQLTPSAVDKLPTARFKMRSVKDLGMTLSSFMSDSIQISVLPTDESSFSISPLPKPETNSKIVKLEETVKHYLNTSNSSILYRILKLNVSKIQFLSGSLTQSQVSVLITRLIGHSVATHKSLRFVIKNKNVLGDDYSSYVKKMNAVDRSVYKSTRSILNNMQTKFQLTLHDYDEIIMYHYVRNNVQTAIELISKIEEESMKDGNAQLHLTNTMWRIKLEILSKTNYSSWKIFGEPLLRKKAVLTLAPKYQYPHHSNNFQILFRNYENDKFKYNYPDDLSIVNIIIKGLGKHSDISSLDKLLESYWGIKIDRESAKGVHQLAHFNIKKNVPLLIWPNEETLISILLAYAKNGHFASAIEINNLLINKYNDDAILNPKKLTKYWELAVRCVALFGDAVEKNALREVQGHEALQSVENKPALSLEIKYRLFDRVWQIAEKYLGGEITREMINLKIKNASSHELLKGLPYVFQRVENIKYNTSNINLVANKNTLHNYVRQCCKELAHRGRFLDANQLIETFITSRETVEELKTSLAEMQEVYARERVKKDEEKRRIVDEDDDFELW